MNTVQPVQPKQTSSFTQNTEPTHKRFIRLAEVMSLTGLCRATVYHYIKQGHFPAPAKFGKSSLWEYNEIQDWINHCLQTRNNINA